MWQYFLIWNKSNLKKCLGEPSSAALQQVLCHGSVQGACSASESFDYSSPEPREAQRGGRHGTEDMDTLLGQCLLWAFFGSCCTPNQRVWNTVSEDSRTVLCVLHPPVPISPLLNHLWIYHLSTALEKGWIACVFLTNHPRVTLTNRSSQIRVTSMDSEVLSALPG